MGTICNLQSSIFEYHDQLHDISWTYSNDSLDSWWKRFCDWMKTVLLVWINNSSDLHSYFINNCDNFKSMEMAYWLSFSPSLTWGEMSKSSKYAQTNYFEVNTRGVWRWGGWEWRRWRRGKGSWSKFYWDYYEKLV